MMSRFKIIFVLCLLSCFVLAPVYAKEITIVYTGSTHAMLYPCNCPKESDGGIARRATLIQKLRKQNPNFLVLDAGSFFAGGVMDEYTQSTELDKERTLVNLKAMELMRYDALALGEEEFNFGKEFLQENINKGNLTFLSCNIKAEKVLPYLVKEMEGIKVGIIGVTALSAMKQAGGLNFIEPKIAVKKAIAELEKQAVDIIILLSNLGEVEDLQLITEVPGIDILVVGGNRIKEEPYSKAGSTLILRPAWQGRKLGKLSLKIKDNKIADYQVEEIRLSDKVADDPAILSILPRCFSDANCKKEGMIGACKEAGTLKAQCKFIAPTKVKFLIITPKECSVCNSERLINYFKKRLPGLEVSYLYYPSTKANKLIRDFNIKTLPVYFLGKEVEKEKVFPELKEKIERKDDFYMLKSEFTGVSYFLDREPIKGRVDLFISPYDKYATELLNIAREFNPVIHFLTVEQEGKFDAARGNLEVEEYLRAVCVQGYYPESFWDYISCRTKNINSSWWEDCLDKIDVNKIKSCARSGEGILLLKNNITLNKELKVMFGPVFLVDNQEVFVSQGIPNKSEIEKFINKK